MKLAQIFGDAQFVLVVVGSERHEAAVEGIACEMSEKRTCYVTLSKTRKALLDELSEKGAKVGNITFIDAISKTIMKSPEQGADALYAASPGALTEISMMVSKCMGKEFDYLLFDSVSRVFIYQKGAPVARFLSNIISQARQRGTRAAFVCIDLPEHAEFIKECAMLVEKTAKV